MVLAYDSVVQTEIYSTSFSEWIIIRTHGRHMQYLEHLALCDIGVSGVTIIQSDKVAEKKLCYLFYPKEESNVFKGNNLKVRVKSI